MTQTQQESSAFSPRPVVRFRGRDQAVVRANLLALQLDDARGSMGALEVRLKNFESRSGGSAGRAFDGEDILQIGADVAVGMGDEEHPGSMFQGYVTSIEELYDAQGGGAPQIIVLCEDALAKARIARRSKVHDEYRISDHATRLAQDLGLTPRVSGLSDSLGTQVQLNESDLAFLKRMLLERDGELQVIEGELHVRPVSDTRRGEIELSLGPQLLRCRVQADIAHQTTEVTVAGWDAEQGRRYGATSQVSDLGPGSGNSGAGVLNRALRARSEHVGHIPTRNEAEARALANTIFAQRARSFVRLEATAFGDARIRVGAHVRLRGVSPRFENTFVVVRTTHRYDRLEGFKTDFEAECAYLKEGS